MKLSELIRQLQISQKAQGTYDGPVMITVGSKSFVVDYVAVAGDHNVIAADHNKWVYTDQLVDIGD